MLKNNESKNKKSQELSSTANNEALLARENEIKNMIKQCDLLLLIYTLKTSTNFDHVMSVAEVAEQLDALIPARVGADSYFPDRTLRRKFELFVELASKNDELLTEINKLLPFVIGGQVTYRGADGIENGTNLRTSGSQKRFYFESVMEPGDMDMICGAIHSNRYLSEQEKAYLLSRLSILMPDYEFEKDKIKENTFRHIYSIDTLPYKPKKNKNAVLPIESSTLLRNIQLIHDAISNNYQIEIIYGTYDMQDNIGKVAFHAKNEEKPYVLNPYAMIWNDGEYYLVATHYGYENPVHFRIDRIISVKTHTRKNKDGSISEYKRSKIPASLSHFFTRKSGQEATFDAIKYTNTYPGMKFHQNSELVDCCFECTPGSLQILIDNFGPNIRLKESPIVHSEDEVDFLGRPQHFLTATVCGIQYDNALGFCIEQAQNITLLSPAKLVKDIQKKLSEISNRYMLYSENVNE